MAPRSPKFRDDDFAIPADDNRPTFVITRTIEVGSVTIDPHGDTDVRAASLRIIADDIDNNRETVHDTDYAVTIDDITLTVGIHLKVS